MKATWRPEMFAALFLEVWEIQTDGINMIGRIDIYPVHPVNPVKIDERAWNKSVNSDIEMCL